MEQLFDFEVKTSIAFGKDKYMLIQDTEGDYHWLRSVDDKRFITINEPPMSPNER